MAAAADRAAGRRRPRRWSASPTAGCRRSRWPAGWWPRAGSARSATSARSTSRTGSSTPRRRCRGGWTRPRPARARSATSARTSSTSPSSSPATPSPSVTGELETFVKERPLPTEHAGLSGTAGTERGPVTVDDAAMFLARFRGGALGVFEATRFATGRKNAIRHRDQRLAGQPRLRLRGHERPPLLRRGRTGRDGRLPPHPGHRAGAPLRRRLVAARSPDRLRARLHPPGRRPGERHRRGRRPDAVVRRRAAVQRVLAAVETSADTHTWQEIPA